MGRWGRMLVEVREKNRKGVEKGKKGRDKLFRSGLEGVGL
jgi:hypothetical protein